MTRTHGFLIAIEGIDGAGKTTQVERLEKILSGLCFEVVRTKEPTQGQYGQLIRQSAQHGRRSPEEELDLFVKDRAEHIETLLGPSLERGAFVLVDRYYYSTVAYQGPRGMDPADLLAKNEAFAPQPDIVAIIDVDPQVGLDRIRLRGDEADLFENFDALTQSRAIFQSMEGPHVLHLNGHDAIEDITVRILEEIFTAKFADRICLDARVPAHSGAWALDAELGPLGVAKPNQPMGVIASSILAEATA